MMSWLIKDFLLALRGLINTPQFTIMNLILVIVGSAGIIFTLSLSNQILFSPLTMNDQSEIYLVEASIKGEAEQGGKVQFADYYELKQHTKKLANVGAYYISSSSIEVDNRLEQLSSAHITPEMFTVTGQLPIYGRAFTKNDLQLQAERVVLLSEQVARLITPDSANIIGQTLRVDGENYRVIGIMPSNFKFPLKQQVWFPLREQYQEFDRSSGQRVAVFAQAAQSVSIEAMQVELSDFSSYLALKHPNTNRDQGLGVTPYKIGTMGEQIATLVKILLSAAAIVLFLACSNVTALLSVKASKDVKSTAVRMALGAPKYRIFSRFIIESFTISIIGCFFGLILCLFGLKFVQESFNNFGTLPFWWELELDASLLLITFIIVLLSTLLSGLWPALQSLEGNFNKVLRDGTRGAMGRAASYFNHTVIFFEIALAITILIYTTLKVASLDEIVKSDYGVKTDSRLVATLSLSTQVAASDNSRRSYFSELSTALLALPEVEQVTFTSIAPGIYPRKIHYQVEGVVLGEVNAYPYVNSIFVKDNYLKVTEIELSAGRMLDSRDDVAGVNNVVIDEKFAAENWPGESALNKRFRLYQGDKPGSWLNVIGITNHVVYGQIQSNALYRSTVYLPLSQFEGTQLNLIAKVSNQNNDLINWIRQQGFKVDPLTPIYEMKSMNQLIEDNSYGPKFVTTLLVIFSIAALLLSSIGVFGVIMYQISNRSNDIAVRRAIGATNARIYKRYLKLSTVLFAFAAVFGVTLAYLGSFTIDTNGFSHLVPFFFTIVVCLMFVIVIIATLIPLKRGMRQELASVLREL